MAAATLVLVVLHPISRIRPEQGIEARRPVDFREMRARPEAHGERSLEVLVIADPGARAQYLFWDSSVGDVAG